MLTDKKLDTNDMTKEEVIELMEEYRKAYEEAIRKPRDIRELLKLDTFQDMTDEEIELVFDFRLKSKMLEYAALQAKTYAEYEEKRKMEESLSQREKAMRMLQSRMDVRPNLIKNLKEVLEK